jgi:MerR family mercuric resistance operon transcriptional regulator
MTDMTIAKLAGEGGVGIETVRFYQRRGLMREPERAKVAGRTSGIRRYDATDVRRLRFIKSLLRPRGSPYTKWENSWRSMP